MQDDMELAPDFFTYFEALAPLLDADDMLMCISSWNDHGQVQLCHRNQRGVAVTCCCVEVFCASTFPKVCPMSGSHVRSEMHICMCLQVQYVQDTQRLYRTDFFPGLGWMLRQQLWEELR